MAFDETSHDIGVMTWSSWRGGVDAPYVASIEQFESFAHEEIYAKVQSMKPMLLSELARDWGDNGIALHSLFEQFAYALDGAMAGWEGRSRDSAEAASKVFAASGDEFADVAKRVVPRLEEIANVAFSLRSTIPAPGGEPDLVAGSTRSSQTVAAVEAAIEVRNQAVDTMNSTYKPTFRPGGVGDGVPAFGVPADPAPGFGDVGDSTSSQSSRTGTSSNTSESAAVTNSAGADGDSAQSNVDSALDTSSAATSQGLASSQPVLAQQDSAGTDTTDESVRPTSTTTSPSQLGTNVPRITAESPNYTPNTSNTPNTPSVASPVLSQSPIVGSGPSATNPGVVQQSSRAAGPRAAGGSGMYPGAGARRQDDDSEHKIPDYLVTEENGNELFGPIPKTAPPVLGVWADRP